MRRKQRSELIVYKEALRIAVGDIVATSYGTGPYTVVSIWGPVYYWKTWDHVTIWPYPVVSLRLRDSQGRSDYHINHVHRREDGRWFTSSGDEVFVEHPRQREPYQFGLFPDPSFPAIPAPYPFQDGVDYLAGDGKVWRCEKCGKDFNTENKRLRAQRPVCPHCRAAWKSIPIIDVGNSTGTSECLRNMNI